MDVVVLGLNRCLGSAFLGVTDLLVSAARIALPGGPDGGETLRVIPASIDGKPVEDGLGRRLPVESALADIGSPAAVIVPGFMTDELGRPPAMDAYKAGAAWLRREHRAGALVCGSCSGTFVLGKAGLLDGRRCTTTWWLHDQLAQQFPAAGLTRGAALTEDQRVVTTGGPVSWIDVALHVVKALAGPAAARRAADFTIVDTMPSAQSAYIPTAYALAGDPLVGEAERIVRHAGESGMNVRRLACQLDVSERTLARRLQDACGESPKTFIDRIRVEAARVALETTQLPVWQVALQAGYRDEASFRRTFKRVFGQSPGAYRTTHSPA